MYREIQNLDQNFSLKSWNCCKTSLSESSRMTPEQETQGPQLTHLPIVLKEGV